MADQDSEALDILRRLEPTLGRIEHRLERLEGRIVDHGERLVRIEATLPHLALKEGVAKLPRRGELWAAIGALSGIFTIVLAALPYLWRHLPP
jgi:hypothetical protein